MPNKINPSNCVSSPLRVAVVLGHWQNYGVETLTLNLYRNIDKNRVQFDFVICETPNSDIPVDEIESLGGRVYIVPTYSKVIKYVETLKRLFASNNYSIVHCHMSTLNVFPLFAAKCASVPVRISHVHTMAGKGEYLKNILKYSLRLFSLDNATNYATSSMMAGRWFFRGKVSDSEMFYLPVARDIEKFKFNPSVRAAKRSELGVGNKFVIGHLGRFVPQKNHSFIVELFNQYHRRCPDSVLVLAGDGPLVDDTLKQVESCGLQDCVLYLGRRSDAAELYQAFDVFVLPSLYEGVPGTGIEAQAAGLPFLFADTITSEAKILPSSNRLPLDDMGQWLDALDGSRRAERRDSLKEMVDAGYSIKDAATRLSDYYESLAVQF